MALKFSDRVESNNPSAYGIVKAIEVSGHKTVSSLSALLNIPDCILSVSGDNTDNDSIGQLWYVVDEGKIYQLQSWENRKSQEGWIIYGGESVTGSELEEKLEKKQDKLIAGENIEITEDNVINCVLTSLDAQIFEFVDKLPPLTEAKENKIYLVPKENGQGENQEYIEYVVVNTVDGSGFSSKKWEKIGENDLEIELSGYLKTEDAENTYAKKTDLSDLQSHTEFVYNINSLFPEQGQGDNKDQWTLTRALSKLDSLLEESDKVSGIKCKFIDSNGDWITYTYYGKDLLEESNWAYDLTSKDFNDLATKDLPVATQEDNGVMSKEDKKRLDELSSGAIDGSIVDKVDNLVTTTEEISNKLDSHIADTNNPHQVTKEQIGLGNVDNTSDLDKPISKAVQEALDSIQGTSLNYTVNGYRISDNPILKKDDLDLGNVDNTSDQNKPVSIAQQAALDNLKSELNVSIDEVKDLTRGHILDFSNPHKVTKEQVGLGRVDNTNDLEKPISSAVQDALAKIRANARVAKTEIDNYTVNGLKISTNPVLSKDDIGLGNIDNTSDLNKPISHLTQDALDALSARIDAIGDIPSEDLTAHLQDFNNPHRVTKDQIGLGNVTNDAQVKRSEMGEAGGVATLDDTGKIPTSQLPGSVDEILEFDTLDDFPETGEAGIIYVAKDTNLVYRWGGTIYVEISPTIALGETSSTAYPGNKGKETTDKVNSHVVDYSNPHQVTKEQVGLGNVDNTSDLDKPISTATQEVIDGINERLDSLEESQGADLSAHLTDYNNPHQVTKEQIGLGNVDNTSDLEKPVSTSQQEAIDAAKEEVSTALTTHVNDKNNPHQVTKEQVGLGNVDNTADLDKPVSTATQELITETRTELEKLITQSGTDLTDHIQDHNNPHQVTKEQIGLGSVDNTADLDKPISNATQAALDALSQRHDEEVEALTTRIQELENKVSTLETSLQELIDALTLK